MNCINMEQKWNRSSERAIEEFDAVVKAIPRDEFWVYLKEARQKGAFSTVGSSGIDTFPHALSRPAIII